MEQKTGKTVGDFLSEVYTDAKPVVKEVSKVSVAYGRLKTIFNTLVFIIICLIFIFIGRVLMIDSNGTIYTQAKITKILDTCAFDGNSKTYNCPVTISYNYNGVEYTPNITYSSATSATVGNTIDINIDKDNFQYISMGKYSKYQYWVGVGMILLFSAMIIYSIFNIYATSKWDTVASAEGIGYLARAI